MTDLEKMVWLYESVNGVLDTRTGCSFEVDDSVLYLMKDGNECWSLTKTELVFDYITRDLG